MATVSRIRFVLLTSVICASLASTSWGAGFDGQRFVPAAGAAGGLMVERPIVPRHLGFGAGVFLNYSRNAVEIFAEGSDEALATPLRNAMTLDLLASVGLFDFLEVAVHLPIHAWYEGEQLDIGGQTLSAGGGLGDLGLIPKVAWWLGGSPTLDYYLGFALPFRFPTGKDDALRGRGAVSIEPRLLAGLGAARWLVSASLGLEARLADQTPDIAGGTALTYGVAGTYGLLTGKLPLDLQLELVGAVLTDASETARGKAPLELLGGVILQPCERWSVYAAVGPGLTRGLGTPDVRAIGGVRYAYRVPGRDRYADTDADDIPDFRDDCPAQLEDYDGFRDDDGCPEADNDNDGILDNVDECPTAAEEPGGDGDGCPDPGRVIITKGRVYVFGKLLFASESHEVSPRSAALLDQIAEALRKHPEMGRINIVGHTDNTGSDAFNLELSHKRAMNVKDALVTRGVDTNRLTTSGLGEAAPIAPNDTPAGRAENRRVDFVPRDK